MKPSSAQKTYRWLCLAVLALATCFAFGDTAGKKFRKPPPSADFVSGFEAGVRYGAMAMMDAQEKNVARGKHPNDIEIPALTDEAKKLYFLIAAEGWKYLVKEDGK